MESAAVLPSGDTDTPSSASAAAAESYKYLTLDLRAHFTPFNLPPVEYVVNSIMQSFPGDGALIVQPLHGRGMGTYLITLTTAVSELRTHEVRLASGDVAVSILPVARVSAPSGAGNRQQGVLVTFVNAAIEPHASIPNADFDKAVSEFGEVIKPTMYQNTRNTSVLNGNRYCVVKVGERPIPGTVVVFNPATHQKAPFHTRYRGQKWFCRRCGEEHVGACEALKSFYEARAVKEQLQVNVKILSDSTLRQVEHVGLRADVLCMSGGGVGHLASVLRDDPIVKERNHITLLTSGNDCRADYDTEGEYAFIIDKGLARIKREIEQTPDKRLTVVYLKDDPQVPSLPPDQALREQYLERSLEAMATDQISCHPILTTSVDMDRTRHPTLLGTKSLVDQLNLLHDSDLIVNEAFVTTERMYGGVQGVYTYGCKTCETMGRFPRPLGICPSCVGALDEYDGQGRWETFKASLPPPPALAAASGVDFAYWSGAAPLINPDHWRGEEGVGGQVEKRPRPADSGSDTDSGLRKAQVTEAHIDAPLSEDVPIDGGP